MYAPRSILSQIVLVILIGISSGVQVANATYTRTQAYAYVQSNLLASTTTNYDAYGSSAMVPPNTPLTPSSTGPKSPNYLSWMFQFDTEYCALWCHSTEVYFVNVDNLLIHSSLSLDFKINAISTDFLEPIRDLPVMMNELSDPQPDNGIVSYPEPDEHLRAILIAGSPGPGPTTQQIPFYNSAARWLVTLKHLGYGDITVLLADYDSNQHDESHSIPDQHRQRLPNGQFEAVTVSLDLDNDGTDDVDGNARPATVTAQLSALANRCEDEDRVFIYFAAHGFYPGEANEENGGAYADYGIKLWDGLWYASDVYNAISDFDHYAEMYVLSESCFGGGLFTSRSEDYRDMEHLHIVCAAMNSQKAWWEPIETLERYTMLTWNMTSYLLGHVPYMTEPFTVRRRLPNLPDLICFRSTQPWRNGQAATYQTFANNNFFDTWSANDHNYDNQLSIREAFEYAWSRIPMWSALEDVEDSRNYYQPWAYNRNYNDHFLYWPDGSYPYNQEGDSSGSVTLTGRGGKVNWASGNVECNWTSTKKYVVTSDLFFPAMASPPTTTIGNQGGNPVVFALYPNIDITIGRAVEPINNVHFTAYNLGDRWGQLEIDHNELEMTNCEIRDSDWGVVIADQEDCDINFDNVEITDCSFAVELFNNESVIQVENSDIWDCDWAALVEQSELRFFENEVSYNEWGGIWGSDDAVLYATDNDFHHNGMGIGVYGLGNYICLDGGYPADVTNNTFCLNEYGVWVDAGATGSSTFLGTQTNPGWNKLYSNTEAAVHNGLQGTTVPAQFNYWGAMPPNAGDFEGAVDYSNPWDGQEGGGAPRKPGGGGEGSISEFEDELASIGRQLRTENVGRVPGLCRRFIEDHPESESVLTALTIWMNAVEILDQRDALSGEIPQLFEDRAFAQGPIAEWRDFIRAKCALRARQPESARGLFERACAAEGVSEQVELASLVSLANLNLFSLKDLDAATTLFERIAAEYPETHAGRMAELRLRHLHNQADGSKPESPDEPEAPTPEDFALLQVFPNPFNGITTVNYALPTAGKVTLAVYDLTGREVSRLVDRELAAGNHQTVWQAESAPTGVYLIRLETASEVRSIKATLVK